MILVHRSERADRLADALGDLLLSPLDDPMTAEVVAVPSRGVERWLAQRLSHRLGAAGAAGAGDGGSGADGDDGVCANVEFPFPGSVVGEATAIACGFDPETDPWPPDRSVWPLLELVDEHLAEAWLEPLVAHLRAGSPPGPEGQPGVRRFAAVRHLADLYDRYAVHRPDMVRRWAGGGGADGRPTTPDGWQAELWRRLRHRIGVPSPAERLATAATRLATEPGLLGLPPRVSLFGLTRLPAGHLRILEAIGRHRDVHVFLLHPSGTLWDAVETVGGQVGADPPRRSDDPTAGLPANPLLRSWGRDAREMQLVLRSCAVTGGRHLPVAEPAPDHRTLLQRLQADIRADRLATGPPASDAEPDARPLLDPDDDSLRVHACHGRLRQVEVMRDAILHLLADDATLEPRDVVVMCPDVEAFAPLISAVFGSGGRPEDGDASAERSERAGGPPQIRIRLADRSIRQTNPVLAVAAQLLDLAAGRVLASEVLDLAGREPVARRFRFGEDDLSQLERWVIASGVRWGLDRGHRAPWRLDQVGANTWQAGLDRLLLGVAMAEEERRLFGGVLPLDDVPSGTVDLAGRLAEFVERLQAAVDQLRGRRSIREWSEAIIRATDSLALAAPHEQWQRDQLYRVLGEVVETAAVGLGGGGPAAPAAPGAPGGLLDLGEARTLLHERLRGRPTRANFRTGDLTFCTLVPMRSVPHRVIGLLGLDDGAFPRHTATDGDDLLLADPRVGDRDGRSEDRQLLLDALLAATEHLVVTYEGRDPRTNQERSPCVPVAELLDAVDRTVRVPDGSARCRAAEHVVVEHPLQSFDWRNFRAGELAGDVPWGFDPVDLAGARARALAPEPPRPFLSRPLGPIAEQIVPLDSLTRFLEHPVRAFLRERLGWFGGGGGDQVKDVLPVELDALERWGVGDRMLDALLDGATLDQARLAELGRGLLPPGALAGRQVREVEETVASLVEAARRESAPARAGPGSAEVNARLLDGRALVGTVPDVFEVGEAQEPGGAPAVRIVRCLYSQLGPRHRLSAWARFLAMTAAHPEREVGAVTIGRGSGQRRHGPGLAVSELPPLGATGPERRTRALAELAVLVDLFDRGMREPLPLYTSTSERYVAAVHGERDVRSECNDAWDASSFGSFGEAGDVGHRLVLGGVATIDQLLAIPARPDEGGPGWPADRSRFGRLARRLWEPIMAHEHRRHLA